MPKIKIQHTVSKWKAPPKNDARLLGMPNIPDPLHTLAPRTIMGSTAWNKVRIPEYEKAGYKCEICGFQGEPGKAQIHLHEVYSTDYTKGEAVFERFVCLCRLCHVYWTHSGRALTMYKHGDPLYSKEKLLEGAEHGFKLISEYNKTHKKPIHVFMTIAKYAKQPELEKPMLELVEKYGIEFYKPVAGKKQAKWEDWKLIWNGREYPTPYKDHDDYVSKMDKLDKKQERFSVAKRMSGGVFDELDELLKEEK